MRPHTRRAIVYVAARLAGGRPGPVYDFEATRHFRFSGSADSRTCHVFDHEERCYVSGSFPGLYHHGNRQHVTLRMRGTEFSGFDYDSRSHYSGSIRGRAAVVYDQEDAKYHRYST
jgi:hypothetical protein